jgi:mycothiol synthase
VPGAWTLLDTLDERQRDAVTSLLDVAEAAAGDEALTEDSWDRLTSGVGARHALRHENGRLTGYALLADADVLKAEPAAGSLDAGLVELLESVGQPVDLLIRPAPASVTAPLEARGWHQVRGLRRLRRELPADPPAATDLEVRAFHVGEDEAAWLAQNNAAFAGHPTQSHMTLEKLLAREQQPWFDPKGFLLVLDGEQLAASCWTKVHRSDAGDVGEIYVISVAPGAQRHGLGRLAVLAGLAHLAAGGIRTAELFVEEDNDRAAALYTALGFHEVARVVELRSPSR